MDNKSVWNEAGLPGLILGIIPVVCFSLTQIKSDSIALSSILWVLKFGGCIFLMYFFMKRYLLAHDDADRSSVFRFGVVVALLSAIICAGGQLGYVLLIAPDTYEKAIDTVMNSGMASQLDSNSLAAIDELLPKLPAITFFCNLAYCFVFGLIVSAIISGSIVSNNPFNEDDE